MALEIAKTFTVLAPPDEVWAFLIDVHRVARCMPGAAITGQLDDHTYTGTMSVKVGPVASSYRGKIVFEKLDAASHTAEIVATGQDVKGKGGADLRLASALRAIGPGQTEVATLSKVNITGVLAQMGRGLIQDVSDQMFSLFSERMRAELEGAHAAAAASSAEAAAVPSAVPAEAAPAASPTPEAAAELAAVSQTASTQPLARAATLSPPPAAPPEALDLGPIGAKVARNLVLRNLGLPLFWLVALAIAAALYWLLR